MSFHFTLFYPENLAPASVNEVLRQLLIPRKWRHFLRIEQNILVNGNYRYFNQNILPGDKIEINLDHVESDQQAYAPSRTNPTGSSKPRLLPDTGIQRYLPIKKLV